MLRNLNRWEGGRICGPAAIDWPGRSGQVLRNLNAGVLRKRVLGTPFIGLTGAQILAQTDSGEFGAGAMANDSLSPTSRYRMIVLASTFADGGLHLEEDGSGYYTSPGAALYMLQEDGAPVSSPAAQRTITAGYAAATGSPYSGGAAGGYPSGPDSQLTLDEYQRRFGAGAPDVAAAQPPAARPSAFARDEERVTLLMLALVTTLRGSSHVPPT